MKKCILIATYNEADNIGIILNELKEYNICIVDDNSPDGTADVCRKFNNVHVIVRTNKRGIASAYLDGFRYLLDKYDYIIQMDAGLTHSPTDVPIMLKKAEEFNYDLVIGSRSINKLPVRHWRTFLSKLARIFVRLLGIKQTDVTSGFRCWRTSFLKKIDFNKILSNGFSFQWELLYLCCLLNANIGEIHINYKLTNSSLNKEILVESIRVLLHYVICEFFKKIYWKKQ